MCAAKPHEESVVSATAESARPFTCEQRVGGFVAIPTLIRELGGDPDSIFSAVGVDREVLSSRDGRMRYVDLMRLMHEAASRLAVPHFGLLAGRGWHLADAGAMGELVSNCPTLGDALETFVSLQYLNSQGGLAYYGVRGTVAEFGYAVYQHATHGVDQVYDAAMAAGTNFVRDLCGASWHPTEVLFSHTAPVDVRHHRAFFRVTPTFDAEYCTLRFPAAQLSMKIAGADPARRRRAEEAIAAAPELDLLQSVIRTLRQQLLNGRCSGVSVAEALSMHRRTLNRRLHERGTTFQRCLDQVRFEVACQLLATSRVSLDDIAATLGYASVTPFMRTFRRWSGTTPTRWRQRAGFASDAIAASLRDGPAAGSNTQLVTG
jgi:AraC-like DNA-binding protein